MEYFLWPAWQSVWLCSLPAPAHLLFGHILETEEKVLDFLTTNGNITATNILLVLNPKHSSYWEEN